MNDDRQAEATEQSVRLLERVGSSLIGDRRRSEARICAALAAIGLFASAAFAQNAGTEWVEREDWSRHFDAAGIQGTVAVLDRRDGAERRLVHDPERAGTRFSPASTFKVPHTLFALDAGIVTDEFDVFEWDGEERWLKSWNGNQNLRSAMRNSVVWVYQRFARSLGEAREREYLQRIGYGNADPSGDIGRFWLAGPLRISAFEQVEFLERLFDNALPFREAHQRLVKDLMINEAGSDWILRAKTGWSMSGTENIGWWIGWIERNEGPTFFALNIDMPSGRRDAPKRISIVRQVLKDIGALDH